MLDIKNLSDLSQQITSNTELQQQFKDDPVKAMQQISNQFTVPDNWIYRIVVGSLGLAVLLVVIGVIYITATTNGGDKTIPTILTAIASGAIGALAGLLAPAPPQQKA